MKSKSTHETLSPDKLRWRCDHSLFEFNTTDELQPCDEIIGQERAIRAISLGLDIDSLGYNIFVTGLVGTGKNTTIQCLLERLEKKDFIPNDLAYLNNFKDPDNPRAVSIPAGHAVLLKKEMELLINSLKTGVPQIFESEEYQQQVKQKMDIYRVQEENTIKDFETKVSQENFTLIQVKMGAYTKPDIFPVVNGEPQNFQQLESLVSEGKFEQAELDRLRQKYNELTDEMQKTFKEIRSISLNAKKALEELNIQVVSPVIEEAIQDIREKYRNEKLSVYLGEVYDDIMNNLDLFREQGEEKPANPITMMGQPQSRVDPFRKYEVNVLVDNSEIKGRPVIIETSPTYRNLFGTIEKTWSRGGEFRSDFLNIKAGSFLKANGGFLVINAMDTLIEAGVWQALKRTLKNRRIELQSYDPFFMITTSALKPEPIDINVKVVLIGDFYLHQLLYFQDDDFKKIFKIRADFDSEMKNTPDNIAAYAKFIRTQSEHEKLMPFNKQAVAAIVEEGVRQAGRQNKISTQFFHILDLLREANYWAKEDGRQTVSPEHVDKAIEEKIRRLNMYEDKIQERIIEGTLMIDTTGSRVGQVNGLAVYSISDYSFGKPSRITATHSLGKAGIINIEREADMSGKTHNKGMLILSGYLREKYAQDKPLTINASICFEQSYSGVDGDSASSTELYALLSSLSGKPIRQDLAVTGSVNQMGEIQPIGGVNEKIEGFFDLCRERGLTGKQGVLIPHQNVPDLMLSKEVVESVRTGKFHIYPVRTIDQGIEILTGVPAGEKDKKGKYKKNTINFLVDKKLQDLADYMQQFESDMGEEKDGEEDKPAQAEPHDH